MTKFAVTTPAYCASCYGQNSELRHIDFDACYDGPVIPGSPNHPVDDLILCEPCLIEAFDLLDPQGQKQRIADLEAQVEAAKEDIRAKDGLIQRFGVTTEELIRHPIQRRQGFHAVTGVPEEVGEYLNGRKADRAKKNRKEGARKAQETMARKAAAK